MSKRHRLSVKPIERAAEDWLKDPEGWRQSYPLLKRDIYTARLTLDITPELHKRIKVAAMRSDRSIALVLRELLEREYPEVGRDNPSPNDNQSNDSNAKISAGTPS
jgi:hypothetical protein